ncbi:hypothetical protein UFOVP629_93 [uncultured Caudovirales phage]|uniref:Uncharacterized protein n=1 Tax=uncultured Caudovirales phage TaxID=2100421 RepID=A0A6J5N7E3_9CAUD|nr:hypothetical protein UFOVP629_93 [uncultured Caudovirales phage]
MKKERQYSMVVRNASKNKQSLLAYADDLMISLDGDIDVDLSPVAEMIKHVRALDWVRHSLISLIREGNDLEQAQALLPTVTELFTAYKNAVSGVNAVLSK